MKARIGVPRPGMALLSLALAALLTAWPTLTTSQSDTGPGMAAAGARASSGRGAG